MQKIIHAPTIVAASIRRAFRLPPLPLLATVIQSNGRRQTYVLTTQGWQR